MEDDEYNAEYGDYSYEPPTTAGDTMDRLKELNRAELFKMIINPDFKTELDMNVEGRAINPFSKELKVSNINDQQLSLASELSDIARNLAELGAFKIALEILAFRDTMLSLSASKDGMLIRAMNTEYQFRKVETSKDKAQKWFRKNRGEMSGPTY